MTCQFLILFGFIAGLFIGYGLNPNRLITYRFYMPNSYLDFAFTIDEVEEGKVKKKLMDIENSGVTVIRYERR